MKLTYRSADGRITAELEAETIKDLFRAVSEFVSIFEADTNCGCCNSQNIHPRTRAYDGNDYFEYFCQDCSAALNLGQHKTGGTLFVKRTDSETKQTLPNRGWKKWVKAAQAGGEGNPWD